MTTTDTLVRLVRTPDGDLIHPDSMTPGNPAHAASCDGTGWARVDHDDVRAVRCPVCRPHLARRDAGVPAPKGWRSRRR